MYSVEESYKFVICLYASKDKPVTLGRPKLGPFPFVLRIDMVGEILGPIYASGFGVTDVGNIIDMTLNGMLDSPRNLV